MTTGTNRLASEKSPYLLQHAHNPVAWYPWSEEAFNEARVHDRPIFLSIGYSTCHWCHVMERESFEDPEIAALMNEAFVCIKVDREERPDIDNIYMTVCQMMTGQGGWPLTIVMTPEREPFHAATYIPAKSRFGRIGMQELIPRISDAWQHRREEIHESVGQITSILKTQYENAPGNELNPNVLEMGFRNLMDQYDREHGGFGNQPKFPTPHRLVFLLRYGIEEGIRAVEHTLEAMRLGGIYDHIGFGFHRYSTDNEWRVPHFEKMLYDQALLAQAYTEAYELTRKPFYRQVTDEILSYVLRDMTSPEGGFYSAEDADSEGEEGRFYTWESGELKTLLGDHFTFAAGLWNIAPSGNYRDESSGMLAGSNIPYLSEWPENEKAATQLERLRKELFSARELRVHPLKDTKILADWNGLMIASLARAARVLGNERYRKAAEQAAAFTQTQMQRDDGTLWHRYCDGQVAVPGQMEDYAFQIQGLLELYDLTLNAAYLEQALQYNDILESAFSDPVGGYFMTSDSAEQLLIRPRNIYDGAIPSGSAVQMLNLLRLARLTGRAELEQQAAATGRMFGDFVQRSPAAFAQVLTALQYGALKGVEMVLVGDRSHPETVDMLAYINGVYDPGRILLLKQDPDDKISFIAPFTGGMKGSAGRAMLYICRDFACEQPISSLPDLKERYPG